ncbi:hypothetical protein [Methanococcus aeolicus]|jgi:hypothetical protein|uniref:Uncharacterized protein n=1 Tax=Methanococcus aeolicus (strain ATCC BAA-1280 / DSM 17508 / OCM 812 / Nankai-3) TaxID=419665 RepID=A6UUA8_META3|nr:hypothetical protein [Methanococcus aeolicus]ABR56080.1 conserved hypothetical protein [Methanococcus aeolicus Nankai-3]UXM85317.1 hypothetical protein N6C89_03305 [Methanococcus aeolicus]
MVKKAIDKLKLKLFGNDGPPVQVPVDDDYVVIGEEYSSEEVNDRGYVENVIKNPPAPEPLKEITDKNKIKIEIKEKPEVESKPKIKIVKEKIPPKLLTARIKAPDDFDNLKKIIEHDVVIINLEDIPIEAIIKEFSDFKKYLETMDYTLGKIDESVIIAVKSGIKLDRYSKNAE